MKSLFLILIVAVTGMLSCSSGAYLPPTSANIKFNIEHTVDDIPLQWDTVIYKNTAGNRYSISKLQYYISSVKLYLHGQLRYACDSVFYIDAASAATNMLMLTGVPFGTYDSSSFFIGVSPEYNTTSALAPTAENVAMDWPAIMGGGYHFIKLEGHWKDESALQGFAMHIGRNGYQVTAGVKGTITVPRNRVSEYTITMNVNEWFRNPAIYDFSTDGVYSMGNAGLMQKLMKNGADVFSFSN